jgi:large subunit ribosomal protein L21
MYAIIADDGRQYKVAPGDELTIDFREDSSAGDQITFDRVLAYRDESGAQLGQPTIDGATVTAEVLSVEQGEKLVVQKFRRRKNSSRKTGHRQLHTLVRISKIEMP